MPAGVQAGKRFRHPCLNLFCCQVLDALNRRFRQSAFCSYTPLQPDALLVSFILSNQLIILTFRSDETHCRPFVGLHLHRVCYQPPHQGGSLQKQPYSRICQTEIRFAGGPCLRFHPQTLQRTQKCTRVFAWLGNVRKPGNRKSIETRPFSLIPGGRVSPFSTILFSKGGWTECENPPLKIAVVHLQARQAEFLAPHRHHLISVVNHHLHEILVADVLPEQFLFHNAVLALVFFGTHE